MNKFPKVNITHSGSLDEVYYSYFSKQEDFKDSKHFSKVSYGKILALDEMPEKLRVLKEEWAKYEKEIFKSMYDITGLSFSRNIIDVYMVRITPRSFSKPIIVSAKLSFKQIASTLIHEFLHILINESLSGRKKILDDILADVFPNESSLTKSHILIYSIMALIYNDVFPNDGFFELDKVETKNYKTNEYSRAIELAESYGFKKIVDDIKNKFI